MFKSQITAIVFLFFTSFVLGQNNAPVVEWQRCFGSTGNETACSIVETNDGGYIYIAKADAFPDGDLREIPNPGSLWVVKLSSNRAIEWQKLLPVEGNLLLASIDKTADGGYIIAETAYTDIRDTIGLRGNDDVWLIKLSANGNIEWQKIIGGRGADDVYSIIQTLDGGYAFVGWTNSRGGDITVNNIHNDVAWLVKVSALGNIEWQLGLGGSSSEVLTSIIQISDGSLVVAGRTQSPDGDVVANRGVQNAWVIKVSSIGVVQWKKCYGGSAYDSANKIIQTKDGGFAFVGMASSYNGDVVGNHGSGDVWVVKLTEAGAIKWQKCLGGTDGDGGISIVQTREGEYVLVGVTNSTNGDVSHSYGNGDGWVVNISAQGVLQWEKSLGGSYVDGLGQILLTPDGGYLVAGDVSSNDGDVSGNHGTRDIWLVKLSSDAKVITGQVQQANSFCQPFIPPQYIANSQVKIEKNNAIYYVSVDSLSQYRVIVDTGRYSVSAVPPNNLWSACPPQITTLSNPLTKETVTINPYLSAILSCPLMEVELTAPFLRRCFESSYTINYANRGTAIQTDAVVELTLDTMLTFVSSTRPIRARNGNKISFSIGNVGINQVGQFDVKVMVSCNSRLGQTHCSTVMIPKTMTCDTIRDTIPTIAIPCSGCDSTTFLVTKPTTGQNQTYQYRLIADASTIDTGRFVLSNTFSLKRKNDGRTYRLELRNVNNNQLIAARAVESTSSSTPSVSTGFVNQFARGIKLSNVAENCTANRGSYDPNEKSAIPIGFGTNHFVEQGTTLEYLVQFQNTGTDTAFTVVVKDTLSALFNLSTIKMTATSHPASWELKPNGLLTVSFKNINLVDSLTNERGSHGFFKYQIRLKDSITTGTRLDNKAAIYFDFNPPIITNLASHTIGKEFIKNCLAKPTVAVTYTGCPTKNISFTAVAKNGGVSPTYSWFRNNETTPLSTNATFTLNNMTNGTKIYCKIKASTDLCTETPTVTSDTIKINCINTATNDITSLQSFDIYPNPNKGVFDIQVQLTKTAQVQVNIINTLGQVLKTESVLADHFSEKYNLPNLSKGIYLIKLTIDEQSIVKRVSVQ